MKLIFGFIVGLSFFIERAHALHFVAYGDTRTGNAMHQTVMNAISKQNPELIIHSGDLWDGYGPVVFKSILEKNPNVAKLLADSLFLVSRGNHESSSEFLAFKPSLVRGGKEVYSFTKGNCFFVSLSMDPALQVAYLETELQSSAAKAATWKFVYSHYPIYSVGTHGGSGNTALEALCDKYNVTMFINGHDHIYNRSHQMYAKKVVDSGSALVAGKGTVYLVSGGGGAPLYAVGKATWSHFAQSINNFTDIVADENQISVKALTPDGKMLDAFTITKTATNIPGESIALPASINVNFLENHKTVILSFAPIKDKGVLEINSSLGAMVWKGILFSGQTSLAWNYENSAKGEFIAILHDGDKITTQKLTLLK